MSSEIHLDADGGATELGIGEPRLLPTMPSGRTFFSEHVRVGRYDLIYRLGSGGMAAVFVGRLSGLAGFERMVAVKIIHQHLADSKKFINMFLDEARMAASIHHPNVVEIYEVGRDQGLFFMVGEFVHGPDLGKLLRRMEDRSYVLPPAAAAHIAAQVCFGLHAAHETRDKDGNPLHLIHRDVSPNNVLLSYDGFVKLIDFGVAWARNKLAHTESGALKGKIGYISPEQILGHEVDRRSDIFSVGVLLYIMSTLTHPFPGKSDAERLNKIISGDLKPPSAVRGDVHPGIERIVLKAMASSPDDRYSTAAEMARDLEGFIESLDETVKPEDIAAILSELFEGEKDAHQASLSAYRAVRDSSPPEMPDGLGSEESAAHFGRTPSSYSVPHRQHRSMWITAVGVLAAALLGVLFYLYLGIGEPPPPAPVVTPAAPPEKQPTATPSAPTSRRSESGTPASGDVGGADEADKKGASEKMENSVPDIKAPPSDNSGTKRRKTKSKKAGSDLLHSPYS